MLLEHWCQGVGNLWTREYVPICGKESAWKVPYIFLSIQDEWYQMWNRYYFGDRNTYDINKKKLNSKSNSQIVTLKDGHYIARFKGVWLGEMRTLYKLSASQGFE